MKVKVLQVYNKNIYLIERYYKKMNFTEYVVCKDYDFKSNTYKDGVILFDLPHAYDTYNTFANTGILSVKECDDGEVEVMD